MTSPGPGISQGTPYEELWKIARSSRDPAEEDKTKRVSEAPFVTAMKKKGRAFDDYADEKYADIAMSEGGDSGPLNKIK